MAAADAVREVTGTDLPFEEAVTQGLVPPPPLMDWNQFQRWRRTDGQRPNRETDGFLRTSRQEAELWKRIMPIWPVALIAVQLKSGIVSVSFSR